MGQGYKGTLVRMPAKVSDVLQQCFQTLSQLRWSQMLFQMPLCRGWDNVMLSLAIMNVMASVNYALALVLALVSLVTVAA